MRHQKGPFVLVETDIVGRHSGYYLTVNRHKNMKVMSRYCPELGFRTVSARNLNWNIVAWCLPSSDLYNYMDERCSV